MLFVKFASLVNELQTCCGFERDRFGGTNFMPMCSVDTALR
jgi:hypothetical protein